MEDDRAGADEDSRVRRMETLAEVIAAFLRRSRGVGPEAGPSPGDLLDWLSEAERRREKHDREQLAEGDEAATEITPEEP